MGLKYQDKSRGMLVGLAVGDALGAPMEFLPSPSDVYIAEMGDKIEHFHKNRRVPEGVWTDDTSMALCIADSLLEKGGYDSYDIMKKIYDWAYYRYRAHPQAPLDVGMQTLRALDAYEHSHIVERDAPKTDSAGNGPIMRLAPIVIADTFAADSSDDITHTLEMAKLSCRETHDSTTACIVTEIFAALLHCLLHGLDKHTSAAHCTSWTQYGEYDSLIDHAYDKDGSRLRDLGGYIVDSFTIALWGLFNTDSFKEGMLAILRLGGDTDTNAAIYGQLAGAHYGYEAIPKEWRDGVYLADELVEIADQLLAMPSCPIIKTRFKDNKHFKEPNE